jgi:hypothetical protein
MYAARSLSAILVDPRISTTARRPAAISRSSVRREIAKLAAAWSMVSSIRFCLYF